MEEHNTQIMNVFVIGIAFLTLVYIVGNNHPNLFLLTFIFAVIALVSYAAYYVSFDGDTQHLNINIHLPEALGIIVGVVGTVVTFRLCRKGFQFDKVRDKYEMLFKEQMKSKN